MLALNERQQAFFVGIRSTFYRMAMLTAMGVLPIVAGGIQGVSGPQPVMITVVAQKPGAVLTPEQVDAAIADSPQTLFRPVQCPSPAPSCPINAPKAAWKSLLSSRG
jgi:MFS transporter, PAT family, beta-lactamase induction signal transducer AmpG